ncbi:MAG: hypothetical protein KGH58_02275 [Candidatus Micrarchaeota archaeon]|nr:hypothetical protein [Candidatus Micrarchaeota archaeon]
MDKQKTKGADTKQHIAINETLGQGLDVFKSLIIEKLGKADKKVHWDTEERPIPAPIFRDMSAISDDKVTQIISFPSRMYHNMNYDVVVSISNPKGASAVVDFRGTKETLSFELTIMIPQKTPDVYTKSLYLAADEFPDKMSPFGAGEKSKTVILRSSTGFSF